jgi:TorA maturation chaperone TorD
LNKDTSADIRQTLAKADLYRFFSLAFGIPEKGSDSLKYLAEEIAESVAVVGAELDTAYRSFSSSISQADGEAIKGEHSELFLTRMRCSPSETSYGKNRFNSPNVLGDISGFYRAFGFVLSEKAGVAHDNIAVEMEFLCFLELKRAYALENGLDEESDVCVTAKKKFLAEHLGTWAEPFASSLQKNAESDFYRTLGEFLSKFISCELSFYDIKVVTAGMDYKPQELEEPITCPAASGSEDPQEASTLV